MSFLSAFNSYNCLETSFVFKEFVHLLLYRPKGHDSVKGKNTLGKSLWIRNAAWTVSPVVRAQPALDLLRRSPSVTWRKRKVPAIAFSTLNACSCRKEKVIECYEEFCHGKSSILPHIWKRPKFLDSSIQFSQKRVVEALTKQLAKLWGKAWGEPEKSQYPRRAKQSATTKPMLWDYWFSI